MEKSTGTVYTESILYLSPSDNVAISGEGDPQGRFTPKGCQSKGLRVSRGFMVAAKVIVYNGTSA